MKDGRVKNVCVSVQSWAVKQCAVIFTWSNEEKAECDREWADNLSEFVSAEGGVGGGSNRRFERESDLDTHVWRLVSWAAVGREQAKAIRMREKTD
jgi:hypothetical protein